VRTTIIGQLRCAGTLLGALLFASQPMAQAQQRLKAMPEYARYTQMMQALSGSVRRGRGFQGAFRASWVDNGQAFEYDLNGIHYRYDIATLKAVEAKPTDDAPPQFNPGRFRGGGPGRGRQFATADSPDKKWKATYRDRNLYLSAADGTGEIPLTTDGSDKSRIKNGSACWVYGEELEQSTAFWWSPDSHKVAYYRFDESNVKDYYVVQHQLQVQDTLYTEPYPKTGAPNPIVDLCIYDLASKQTTRVDVRDGKPFDDTIVGHYVYGIEWSKGGTELLLHRTNRRQNVMEYAACNPDTGKCRVIFREEWPTSWTENLPKMEFLKDGKRFILASDRTGWRNYYLYDLSGNLLATLTAHEFDVDSILRVDEERGLLYYMAHDGDNPMKLQLHRVGLDGKNDTRLTDPAYLHNVNIAPDGQHIIDTIQTHDTPPETRLLDATGHVLAPIIRGDDSGLKKLHVQAPELFTYKAADGKTDLYGLLYKPSNFDPNKKYPLLVSVYGGPETNGAHESFSYPDPLAEFGFLIATLDSRSAAGRGKRFLDAIYEKFGITEIDDQAAGVKALRERPYVDGKRVGVFGTSYGGYASDMCLLRYPDVFQAACACSGVTDWRLYDSIYTERYMWLPTEDKAGYDAASAMTYAGNLKGRLLIYYGTADDNVHPSQSLQLIAALQHEDKSFDVQVGPDRGHSALNTERMMEFFIDNLAPQKSAGE
jgi:dipeptidyl-peptidase 4